MMTFIVIGFILLAITPLIWSEGQVGAKLKPIVTAELQVQIEAWGGQGFLGKTVKAVVKQYEKDQKEAAEKVVREEKAKVKNHHKDIFLKAIKDAGIKCWDNYGSGSKDYPLCIRIPTDKLSETRAALRAHYGTWSDKVETVNVRKCWTDDWSEQRNMMEATYLGPEIEGHYLALEVRHEMDAIPEGLLKPGCKIEEEVRYSVTCET